MEFDDEDDFNENNAITDEVSVSDISSVSG